MKQIPIEEIIEKAKSLNEQHKNWHFHMLGKVCSFNQHKGKFNIVLETDSESYYSLFDDKPAKESKILADLVYGANFLKKDGEGEHNPDFDQILQRAKELKSLGVEWHHHHLFPKCIFNKNKGKSSIILEDPQTNTVMTAVYEGSPMKDLTKLEDVFHN